MSKILTDERLAEIDAELQHVPTAPDLWPPVGELRAMVKEIREVRDNWKKISRLAHGSVRAIPSS